MTLFKTIALSRLTAVLFAHLICCLSVLACLKTASAYDLGKPQCGGEYGGLNLIFPKNVRKFTDIDQKLSSIPWAKTKFLVGGTEPSTIYSQVQQTFFRKNAGSETNDVAVPIGSEQYVAQALKDADVIAKATFAQGFCGGAEVSYVYITKNANVGNLIDSQAFVAFVSNALKSYVKIGTVDEGPLVVAPIEPHYPMKRFTIAVPSEVSRGPQAKGSWDRFDIVFALYTATTNEFRVVIHAENLRTAPKVAARATPPSAEHFRPTKSDSTDYELEYVVAASVASYVTRNAKMCKVEGEGFTAQSDGPFRCTHP
jgi:hypothetical protein